MARKNGVDRTGSILIADDHEVVRQCLGYVLRRELAAEQVIEAATFDEALERLADRSIFLAIFDLGMPGLEGPGDLAKVRRLRPDMRVVVLSGSESRGDVLAALEPGVRGYLVKNARTEILVKRIRPVLDGEIYVPPVVAELPREAPATAASEPRKPSPASSLTARQSACCG